jgi:hypothetical protein
MTIDDGALHLACVEYLMNHGYPIFFEPVDDAVR